MTDNEIMNELLKLDRNLEDITINRIAESITHEMIHILCKTKNEEFIISIPKLSTSWQWEEKTK